MIPLFEAVVGSSLKLWIKSSDIDVRALCVDPNRMWIFPSNKYEWRPNHHKYDYDWWELWYAIRQILRWDNSSPLLNACLYSNEFKLMTEEWRELIDNREKLLNSNLIKGTIKYCDRKVSQSKRSGNKYHSWKYLYYAISDLIEQEMILKWELVYPISSNKDLLLSLKKSDENIKEWYSKYEELKNAFSALNVTLKPDTIRLESFVRKCNKKYW